MSLPHILCPRGLLRLSAESAGSTTQGAGHRCTLQERSSTHQGAAGTVSGWQRNKVNQLGLVVSLVSNMVSCAKRGSPMNGILSLCAALLASSHPSLVAVQFGMHARLHSLPPVLHLPPRHLVQTSA